MAPIIILIAILVFSLPNVTCGMNALFQNWSQLYIAKEKIKEPLLYEHEFDRSHTLYDVGDDSPSHLL